MSKKQSLTSIDFDFGVGKIIPATQEAFSDEGFDVQVRKTEKESLSIFKSTLGTEIDSKLTSNELFPTDGEVFLFIVQRVPQDFAYCAVKRLSSSQDVDALKISGLERSVTMFQELKNKKIL
ncbi:MAG: hypothetical protein HYT43_00050 [Candidatus Taylorbacteria bacterium]|nr:hypothetical protein [Candidatus Taylorbacteria bacterium]